MPSSQAARPALKLRLSVMMFLQYAIWGAWLPLLYPFLKDHRGFDETQIATMFAVGAVGALLAPFVAGQVADRWFPTQWFLGISHVAGGLLVWQLANIESFAGFLTFSLVYSLIYSPTLPLTNSLSFHHLPDRDRDFGRVRVWGTVGWIAVGIGIGQWLLRQHADDVNAGMADAFRLSALLGVGLGVYCLTLPHTPPSRGEQSNATFEALGEIWRQPLLLLFLLAVPISCIHQFYVVRAATFLNGYQSGAAERINEIFGVGGAGLMTIGQMSEILVLALVPLMAKKFSRKSFLAVGTVAYALRMFLFAWVDDIHQATGLAQVAILIPGIALHGLCFGCWIFVAFMIVDEETSGDVRASAQSLFYMVIIGVGIILGSYMAGWVADWSTHDGVLDHKQLFSVPMWASLACLVILMVGYPGGRRPGKQAPGPDY